MIRDLVAARLMADEGTGPMQYGRHLPYMDCCGRFYRDCTCPKAKRGNLTIGYGANIEPGIRHSEAMYLLNSRLDAAVTEMLGNWPWMADADNVRQAVLCQLLYQMGALRLAKFKRMLAAMQAHDYQTAAKELLDSEYGRGVSAKRARVQASCLLTGQWV